MRRRWTMWRGNLQTRLERIAGHVILSLVVHHEGNRLPFLAGLSTLLLAVVLLWQHLPPGYPQLPTQPRAPPVDVPSPQPACVVPGARAEPRLHTGKAGYGSWWVTLQHFSRMCKVRRGFHSLCGYSCQY